MVNSVSCNKEIPQKMKSEFRNKRESNDDSEIDEMAREFAKRRAEYKQTNSAISLNLSSTPSLGTNTPTIPEESCSVGRFGWEDVKEFSVHIPYILRGDSKYVAKRIVNHKVWNRFIPYFSSEVFDCMGIEEVPLSVSEAELLDEINFTHCDSAFGKTNFNADDKLIPLQSMRDSLKFLMTCFNMLINQKLQNANCGFMRIDENVVPFAYINGMKALPLFYFDGESEYLQSKAFDLPPREMMYLRFCCALQQIRKEHYNKGSCKVIYLEDLKLLFPNTTKFEDFWPDRIVLLLKSVGRQRRIERLGVKRPKLKILMNPYTKRLEALLTSPTVRNHVDRLPWPLPTGWKNPYSRMVHLFDIDIPEDLPCPYTFFRSPVYGQVQLTSITLFPYCNTPYLVSLREVHMAYFSFVSWEVFMTCINLLGFTIFSLNRSQMRFFHNQHPGYFVQMDELVDNTEALNFLITNRH